MQVFVDADYLELIRNDGELKRESGEYSPFARKKVPVVSLEDVKKMMSLPKDQRQKMLLDLSNNSSYT